MKKTNFFKILVIIMLVFALLSWFIPAGYFSGEYVESGITRLGFVDFCQYLILPFFQSMFLEVLIFLLSVGALYGVLRKIGSYNNLVESIAKKFKKKGALTLILIALIIAMLSSFGGYGLIMLIFIPFIVSIILAMGYDKTTAFVTTFGAMLIGVIGSTFAESYIGQTLSTLSLEYTSQIYYKIALFVLSFILYIVYVVRHAKNIKNVKNEDPFLGEETSKKKPVLFIVLFACTFVLMILGCTNWNAVFGITVFTRFHELVNSVKVADVAIFNALLGNSAIELGTWSYFQMAIIVWLLTIIVSKHYKAELAKNAIEGIKVVVKPALLMMLSYGVLILVVNTGVYTTLMSYVLGAVKKFNAISLILSVIINSIGSFLHVELPYAANFFLTYLASTFSESYASGILNVMSQAIYGLTMFVAPTSLFVIFGLTYLDIPYKKWLKYSWKLVIELLIIILIVLITMLLILK